MLAFILVTPENRHIPSEKESTVSIKDLDDGWKEYWFYYGNANWPSDETYRYHEERSELLIRSEIPLIVTDADGGRKSITLSGVSEILQGETDLSDITVLVSGSNAWLFTWVKIERSEHAQAWEFFLHEKAKEEQYNTST